MSKQVIEKTYKYLCEKRNCTSIIGQERKYCQKHCPHEYKLSTTNQPYSFYYQCKKCGKFEGLRISMEDTELLLKIVSLLPSILQ